ncbi:hypothetical protein BDV35DRAFT_357994 [Aspergillus flavus]|uniref:Uncharacterized protein n=1 Tax=Aspergillus flavus TaxID=5059 RepID=A0A5N6GT23_ASPFL|nr:hypothetical protein BDV35DRAFT_357994 [Aspergillus flavus]
MARCESTAIVLALMIDSLYQLLGIELLAYLSLLLNRGKNVLSQPFLSYRRGLPDWAIDHRQMEQN